MIVSSSGDALGAGVGVCADSVVASAEIDNRRQNICLISEELVGLQEVMHFLRQFSPDPFGRGNFLHARFAQAIDRSKPSQEEIFPVLTDARTIVKDAFVDALLQKKLVICVREPMRFVANSLK